jgi:hypothetical protein
MSSILFNLQPLGFALVFLAAATLLGLSVYRGRRRVGIAAGALMLGLFGLIAVGWRVAQFFQGCDDCVLGFENISIPIVALAISLVLFLALAMGAEQGLAIVFPSSKQHDQAISRERSWLYLRLLAFSTLLGLFAVVGLGHVLERGLLQGWQLLESPASDLLVVGYPIEQDDLFVGYPGQEQATATPYYKPDEQLRKLRGGDHRAVVAESTLGNLYTARLSDCSAQQGSCWSRYQARSDPQVAASVEALDCAIEFIQRPAPAVGIDRWVLNSCQNFETRQTEFILLGSGSVWVWQYRLLNETDQQDALTYAAGPLLGYLFGLLILSWQDRRNRRRSAGRERSNSELT